MNHVMPMSVPVDQRTPEAGHAVRAALMLRVSTQEQAQGHGLDIQENAGRVYVESRPGWVLRPELVFRDEGVSGALVHRPAMLLLEQAARQGLIDVVVVHKFDRIGRTGKAFWTWIWAMEDLGVGFASVTQDIDTTTAFGRQQLQFHALMAETEWKLICERTQGGRQRTALEGGWVGGPPPWGYAVEQTGKRGSTLVINEPEARVVRTAVRLIVEEKKNVSEAARELNALGCLSRSGRPWTASNLHRRLKSPVLLKGEVVFRNPAGRGKSGTKLDQDGVPLHGDSVTIVVPRIVPEGETEALAEAMRERGHASHAAAESYPLSGRILGTCGHRYVGSYRKTNGTRYYRCGGGNNGKGPQTRCSDAHLTADDVEAAVWREVMALLADPQEPVVVAHGNPRKRPGSLHKQRERVAELESSLREKGSAAARTAVDLARIPGLDQAVKDAVTRQLAQDVRDAAELLARAREVFVEQEEAERGWEAVWALTLGGTEQPPEIPPSTMRQVVDLLDVTVRPLGRVRKRSGVKCKVTAWHARTATPVPDEVPETEWPAVEELMAAYFPRAQFARGPVDVRTQVNGILHRLRTGCLWDELPERYGPWALAKDRQNTWFMKGFWPVLVHHLVVRGGSTPIRCESHVPPLLVTVNEAAPLKGDSLSTL